MVSEGRKLWEIPEETIDEVLTTYMDSENAWLQAIAVDAAGKHLESEPDEATAEWRAQFKARASEGDPLRPRGGGRRNENHRERRRRT